MAIPFSEEELMVTEVIPEAKNPRFEHYAYPITPREEFLRTYSGNPEWLFTGYEIQPFHPSVVPDNVARGFVCESGSFDPLVQAGGKDMFGIEWTYIPAVGGSMEAEGMHLFDNANDWKSALVFPDVDSWDWEGSAKRNEKFIKQNMGIQPWIFTGWFERLISFMGFEDAAVSLLDEDQEDALKELMMALTDTYINIIDHFVKYYEHVDGIFVHDDWCSQVAPFFSKDVAEEFFVPAMRKLTDHCHSLGLNAELHSCGCHGSVQIENIIAAGWDAWMPQPLNDIESLWEQYGDRILLSPVLGIDLKTMSEEEQITAVDRSVERFCTTPGKSVCLNIVDRSILTPLIRRELYVKSRQAYSKWPKA